MWRRRHRWDGMAGAGLEWKGRGSEWIAVDDL